jgi:hypothetical protein
MKITESEIAPDARRFLPSPIRMAILGLVVVAIYGGGILSAVWAGHMTVKVTHSGGELPILPWLSAFLFVITGMLSVIYAFFFRPREVRLTDSAVAMLWWDGNGKVMKREAIESVRISGSKITLTGGGETLTIPPIFLNAKVLGERLKTWVA